MKIGIFMAYGPQTVLGKEGLGRYIGNLVKGFTDVQQEVIMAVPKWSTDTISELFEDFGVSESSVSFAVLERIPAIWGAYSILKGRKKKKKTARKYRVLRKAVDWAELFAGAMLNITNLAVLGLVMLLLCVVGVVLLPFALVGAVVYVVLSFLKSRLKKGEFKLKDTFWKLLQVTKRLSKTGLGLDEYIYTRMMNHVTEMLVQKANRQDVDVWFVPALFWPETKGLKKVRVITVPDVVTKEFPLLCANMPRITEQTKKCVDTIENGEYFITYCDYVRQSLLEHRFGKYHGVTIEHPDNELNSLIAIDASYERKLNARKNFTDAFARGVLRSLPPHTVYGQDMLVDYSFENTRYIFYASQARPYKNILNLIKAYEELLRKRYVDVKLFLTCDLTRDAAAYQYVMSHHLQFDVICFYNISAQQLAALYRCADLVVNPTLYEGGFPFTLGEGMSVGTPSLMSDIPQVRDVVEKYGLEDTMLFDPYDWMRMADKIEYALQHREELYQKQLGMYQHFAARSNEVVAKEYIAAFEHFINEDRKKRA